MPSALLRTLRALPALPCLGAFVIGVALGEALLPSRPLPGALALLLAVLVAASTLVVRPVALPLAFALGLAGLARAALVPAPTPPARAAALAGRTVTLIGEVKADPTPTAGGYQAFVQPQRVTPASVERSGVGAVLVRVHGGTPPQSGEVVRVEGRLQVPRDSPGFDTRAYLARQGASLELQAADDVSVLAEPQGWAGIQALPARVRAFYQASIDRLLPQPEAAVLVGIVLGVRSGVPAGLRQQLIDTGLVHLLVLSGLKVAIFARLVGAALTPVLRRAAVVPVLGLVALYCLAGGATPAAVRASAMGGLTLVAGHLGRRTHVWMSLAFTAAMMLAAQPELAEDVGFQLSFLGTAAIVLLTPGIEERLRWVPAWLREPFAVTCAAQVGTLPVLATGFGVISPSAPLSNTAVLPLLPAMVAGGLLVTPLAALPEVGRLAAVPLVALLQYLDQVAAFLARLPAAAIPVPGFPTWAGAAYYLAVGGLLAGTRFNGRARRAALVVGIAGPLLVTAGEVGVWTHRPPSATALDVGGGQAVLLRGPGGTVLIDGGQSPASLASALGRHLPPWERRLDALVVTAPSLGHVGGLRGLPYTVGEVVVADRSMVAGALRDTVVTLTGRGARLAELGAGLALRVAGLEVQALTPEPDASGAGQLAIRVRGPSHTFCDLADLDADHQLDAASRLPGPCDSLLVPGQGKSVPAPGLLRRAHPHELIVSDTQGARLPRGFPPVSRTSQEGDVEVPL